MSADDLDPPKLAGHGMPLLEIENLHVEIDGKKILKGALLEPRLAVLDCRASFAIYNTRAEVDILAQALLKAQEFFT